jgi:hypothetical protein
MQLMPAGKCVAITNESAPLDGLTGQRLFQTETQIEFSIFQNG